MAVFSQRGRNLFGKCPIPFVLVTSSVFSAGKKYAQKVQKQLSTVFANRGIKQRNDLYILNSTKPPAILLETFFCTNKSDYKKAKGLAKRTKLAKLVAKGIGKAR